MEDSDVLIMRIKYFKSYLTRCNLVLSRLKRLPVRRV